MVFVREFTPLFPEPVRDLETQRAARIERALRTRRAARRDFQNHRTGDGDWESG